jgi:hypothetical protein
MSATTNRSRPGRETIAVIAIAAVILQMGGAASVRAQEGAAAPAAATEEAPITIPPDELDSLVAPIALYSDPLLAQVLVASTYPLEIIQLQQWLGKNPGLEGDALAEAVAEQPWDPSIQSMAALPDLVTRLANDIQWVTELGNAFLTNQTDVMEAVQRMRAKAKEKGSLETNEQQVVTTEVVETKTVIVVQPADPEIIYVPSYNPTYVYPPPVYPYPPVYYPPYNPGGAFVAFSVGVMWGAAIWGGSCCHCGWGHSNVNININNNFNRNSNVNVGGGNWQHNPNHRGGTPYSNKATASKYGGSARGDSMSSRQATARQQQAGAGNRSAGASADGRPGGAGAGSSNRAAPSAGSRPGGSGASTANRAAGSTSDRSSGPSAATANRAGGGGPSPSTNNIGSRNIPSSSGSRAGGFGGSSAGFSGSSARAASSRGASSMASRGGGGGRRR